MRKRPTLFLLFILFICADSFAQVQAPFTPRYSESITGDFTIIANNVLSRHASNDYNGDENNNNEASIYVDIDNDNSTFNSCSANFTNPDSSTNCISIIRAFIYWAASDKEQDNGDDNEPNWNFDDIKLMLPGETTYSTITADEVIFRGRDTHFSNDPYICFKDITNSVLALPNIYGTYQVANVETKVGFLSEHPLETGNTGPSGGWQIVFVREANCG